MSTLRNGYFTVQQQKHILSDLRCDPTGKGRRGQSFCLSLIPEDWEITPRTLVRQTETGVTLDPLQVYYSEQIALESGGEVSSPERLEAGHTLAQTFRIVAGQQFTTVSVYLPTWHTTDSGCVLSLYRGGTLLASRRLQNVPDNSWQSLSLDEPLGEGEYTVQISEPKGSIGWWSSQRDVWAGGTALVDGQPVERDRALRVDSRRFVGEGRLVYRLQRDTLLVEAELRLQAAPPGALRWTWSTTWTKSGYDCTSAAGVVFSRFFTDNQRYMPVQQLKRRDHAGLSFDRARWIEMEGTRDADLRIEGNGLHLHWEMEEKRMHLRLHVPYRQQGDRWISRWGVRVLPRTDSVPDTFPRFVCPQRRLEQDVNRFWWERAFTYPAPAGPAAWFEWMATMRCWYDGDQRRGEMEQLRTYPITREGYVHTWGAMEGWPFPPSPPYDTRHFDTNARFILACWRFYLWTGDTEFLKSQADCLRRAMAYQLETLKGHEGLIITASKDVNGRHQGVGNNYWDILPFGHLDAYANAVYYASLEAMQGLDAVLHRQPLTDYRTLRQKVHRRYDEVFWDDKAGRYIGCVDIDGVRHDYGFTFVNLEALYYGLGDAQKARRIYRWMETEPTSTGRPDSYSKWIFAPRANTIHNPMWGENAPPEERNSQVPPWWHFGWHGTPYGDQCQDGGAILYTSYFDLMVRLRYFGIENAWKRFGEIVSRYRMPDRLCGGPPLFRGEIPQQENPGQVGVDLPFPESGLVPCFLLYGVLGVEATAEGLRIHPRLPAALPAFGVDGLHYRGNRLRITATLREVIIEGNWQGRRLRTRLPPGGGII